MLKTIKLTSSYLTTRKCKKENKKIIKLTVARVLLKVFLMLHRSQTGWPSVLLELASLRSTRRAVKCRSREEVHSLGSVFKTNMQSNLSMGGLVGFVALGKWQNKLLEPLLSSRFHSELGCPNLPLKHSPNSLTEQNQSNEYRADSTTERFSEGEF